jgi:hypothetical protein
VKFKGQFVERKMIGQHLRKQFMDLYVGNEGNVCVLSALQRSGGSREKMGF